MIYAIVSDELKNKYLKENSLACALLGNRKTVSSLQLFCIGYQTLTQCVDKCCIFGDFVHDYTIQRVEIRERPEKMLADL